MEQYNVTGMSCAACSARVEKAVSSLPGVTECSVNLLTNSMNVSGEAKDEEIILRLNYQNIRGQYLQYYLHHLLKHLIDIQSYS